MSERVAVRTEDAPTPTGPFSQAIRRGPLLFTAGQAGRNRDTGEMGGIGEQTAWALKNITAILEAGGAGIEDVVKVTIFAKEGSDVAELNREYEAVFKEPLPARTLVFISKLKNPEMLVEIEAVAVVDG